MQNETQSPPAKPPQNGSPETSPSPPHEEGIGDVMDSSTDPAPKAAIEKPPPAPSQSPPIPSGGTGGEKQVKPSLEFRQKVREGQIRKLEKRLKKVWELAKAKGKITNNDIEKHLRVSDDTAFRYAKELVKRGLLKKSGKTKSSFYEAV